MTLTLDIRMDCPALTLSVFGERMPTGLFLPFGTSKFSGVRAFLPRSPLASRFLREKNLIEECFISFTPLQELFVKITNKIDEKCNKKKLG